MADGRSHKKTKTAEIQSVTTQDIIRVADQKREYRSAIIDTLGGIVGVLACVFHLLAPWRILLDIFQTAWILQVLTMAFLLWSAANLIYAIRLHHELSTHT